MRYDDIVNNAESVNIDEQMSVPVETSVELSNQHLAAASHFAPSFRARFSLKFKQNGADNVQQNSQVDSVQNCPTIYASLESCSSPAPANTPSKIVDHTEYEDGSLYSIDVMSTPARKTIVYIENKDGSPKSIDAMSTQADKIAECTENKDVSLKSIDAMSTPVKHVSTPISIDAMSTPVKHVSTPIRLMSATPALRSPKRCLMSPDDHPISSLNKLARRPSRSRSLRFDTPVNNKEVVNEDNAGGLPIDDDVFDILPENLVQSVCLSFL